jgi:hypothetical protein
MIVASLIATIRQNDMTVEREDLVDQEDEDGHATEATQYLMGEFP